jgi:putative FmdB family regulatory protein
VPTYEYTCRDCGERLEVQQSFSDAALTECPSCRGALRKVFGNIGISFKGSGFYKTDSRSSSSGAKPAAKETPSATGAGSTSTSGSTSTAGSGSASGSGAASSGSSSSVAAAAS